MSGFSRTDADLRSNKMPYFEMPELVVAILLIGLPVWMARRVPIPEKVFPNYMVIGGAVLFLVYLYNWTTTFRPVH